MIVSRQAEGFYLVYPKQRAVMAFGPVIPGADDDSLREAHAYIDDAQTGALAEVRYLFSDQNLIHSTMYLPGVGYGDNDVPASHDGLVNIRKVELLKMPMPMQCEIIRASLQNVVDEEMVDRIESLYRMNIPLAPEYIKLLTANAVFGIITDGGHFEFNSDQKKRSMHELMIHVDKWTISDEELGIDNSFGI